MIEKLPMKLEMKEWVYKSPVCLIDKTAEKVVHKFQKIFQIVQYCMQNRGVLDIPVVKNFNLRSPVPLGHIRIIIFFYLFRHGIQFSLHVVSVCKANTFIVDV